MASKIFVDQIIGRDADGNAQAAVIGTGVSVTDVTLTGTSSINATGILTATEVNTSDGVGMNITGIITAANFFGAATGLTGLPSSSISKVIAYTYIQ
jgi:hypothetical protein